MSFLKKLSKVFSSPSRGDSSTYWIHVRCNRCGEAIRARVSLYNDLSPNYEEAVTTYFCRKVLMGEQRCFQQIEVSLTFDQDRKVIDQQASGGKFISEAEYYQSQEIPA